MHSCSSRSSFSRRNSYFCDLILFVSLKRVSRLFTFAARRPSSGRRLTPGFCRSGTGFSSKCFSSPARPTPHRTGPPECRPSSQGRPDTSSPPSSSSSSSTTQSWRRCRSSTSWSRGRRKTCRRCRSGGSRFQSLSVVAAVRWPSRNLSVRLRWMPAIRSRCQSWKHSKILVKTYFNF